VLSRKGLMMRIYAVADRRTVLLFGKSRRLVPTQAMQY